MSNNESKDPQVIIDKVFNGDPHITVDEFMAALKAKYPYENRSEAPEIRANT